jgi:hypothetical protein
MTPEEKAEKVTNRMKMEYGLNDEQTAKVKKLNQDSLAK